jgi:hypothetical protein
MKSNNYNIYKVVHSSQYDSTPIKETKIGYKNELSELIRQLGKRNERTESENLSKAAQANANTYNHYLNLTKTERHRTATSGNHSQSKSQSQKPIKIEHGAKAKELIQLINACINHDFTFTPENSQILAKISKSLKVCQNLDELLMNEIVVDQLMSLICKYIFRNHKYKSIYFYNFSNQF